MTTDLLFSILPREGKVPIVHDSQKVARIDKQEELRTLNDQEKELKGEEKEARKKQQQHKRNAQKPEKEPDKKVMPAQVESKGNVAKNKKTKGPRHLDIYV
jgi:16S rRNA U1498 N3-methylase RsmE